MNATTEPKTYRHNQICTRDNTVRVGAEYDYYEDGHVMRVRVLEDTSDDEGLKFNLEIISGNEKGRTFNVFAASGLYAYSGMWRIYDAGTYLPQEVA